MVIIDVVYNHFGPSGNYLREYAAPFFTNRHPTPWGDGINFDGAQSRVVRDYFIHNALYWLEEFHADGLRFDAVHAIRDESETHILAEIATGIRAAIGEREVHLILENDANESRWLERDRNGRPRFYAAQWNDDLHHSWHVLLTGEREGYYKDYAQDSIVRLGRALAEGFTYQGEPSAHRDGKRRGEPSAHLPPTAFVAFLQNHDQIGNRASGERLCHLAEPGRVALAHAALLLAPQIPLMFMGEDWAASSPFQFFVDFGADEDLSRAVRDGRRREFARFSAFAKEDSTLSIPDPTAPETTARSTLDWEERSRGPHSQALDKTKHLLRLRAARILPLARSAYLGASFTMPWQDGVDVSWHFAAGPLRFVANLGDREQSLDMKRGEEVLWISLAARAAENKVLLPAWTGVFLVDGPQ
jgi:maltooligosyltrehalose trehalohydrolase